MRRDEKRDTKKRKRECGGAALRSCPFRAVYGSEFECARCERVESIRSGPARSIASMSSAGRMDVRRSAGIVSEGDEKARRKKKEM